MEQLIEVVPKRREVSDEECRAALKNQDNANLIKSECSKFAKQLSEDDLDSCSMQALWRALQYHRDEFRQKFTTTLYKFLNWELLRALGRQTKSRKRESLVNCDISDLPEAMLPIDVKYRKTARVGLGQEDEIRTRKLEHVKECMGFLPRKFRKVIEQHFLENRTMEEIGALNGYSKETARQRLAGALDRMKELCSEKNEDGCTIP